MTQVRPMLQDSRSAPGPPRVRVPAGRKPQPPFVEFGRYLKACRERAGFRSQRDALRAPDTRGIHISQALLAHYESGRVRDPSPLVLSTLASRYRCGLHEILLHLARAKFRSVCAEETPLDRARWDIVESSLARVGEIGCGTDLELDQLRARASLLREVEILDAEGLARWQRSLEGLGAIWVVAPFFVNDEEECLLDAVVHNLRRGVRYTFLLYPESRAEFESLLTNLQVRIGAEGDLATAARPLFLPPAVLPWLHADSLIANPHRHAQTIGFQRLRVLGKARLAFRLASGELRELVERVDASMAGNATP